ncbi:MAG TPA: gamma-glutamyltransferase [Chloroflexota bacterium]|jgi:gamma-glutamyltranspeptidase/glutathione hydrolase
MPWLPPARTITYSPPSPWVHAEHGVVSAQHPAAAEAGIEILQAGGNVVDAAVAAVFAAAVADVGRTGIGGYGGHLVYRNADSGLARLVDFPTYAPRAADGCPIVSTGPLAVSVPGVVAGLEAAHAHFGRLEWAALLAPALRLARHGIVFPSPGRDQIFDEAPRFAHFAETMRVFVDAWESDRLRQPDLAGSLRALAEQGAAALYDGDLGAEVVRYVRAEGGILDHRDLLEYRTEIRTPMECTYHGFDVFTSGAESGGDVLVRILGHLEGLDTREMEPLGPEPMLALVGATADVWSQRLGSPAKADAGCTDHLVVADTDGNVVSVTTTLQRLMGSGVTVPGTGIVLNNGMSLFSDETLAGAKRAVTNMSPTIVVKGDRPVLAIGASGGRRIPSMVIEPLTLMLDHRWTGDRALTAPRYHTTGDGLLLLEAGLPEATVVALRERGYGVEVEPWGSLGLGGQSPALWFDTDGRLFGAPDPRRHGGAAAW